MNIDQIRDELARRAGWEFDGNSSKYRWWKFDVLLLPSGKPSGLMGRKWSVHPMPPTLDGVNDAVPEGWFPWERRKEPQCLFWEAIHPQWRGGLNPHMCVRVPDTGDPVHDLYALALACVRAEEKR